MALGSKNKFLGYRIRWVMGSICNCLINPAWVMKNCPDESAKLLDKRSIVTRSISKIMFATGIAYYLVGFYIFRIVVWDCTFDLGLRVYFEKLTHLHLEYEGRSLDKISLLIYHTRANMVCGLYTFYPLFKVHLCTVTFGVMHG